MPTELAPRYYLDHFETLLRHVETQYGTWLSDRERGFIDGFRALTMDARCLFVRMSNRRGELFRVDRLNYRELTDRSAALDGLIEAGFASWIDARCELQELFPLFTKKHWIEILEELGESRPFGGMKKDQVLAVARVAIDRSLPVVALAVSRWPVVQVCHSEIVETILFMFFGGLQQDLSEFVTRDLGHIQLERVNLSKLTPRFSSRRELDECLAVSRAYRHLRDLEKGTPPDLLFAWVVEWQCEHPTMCDAARNTLDKMFVKVGRALERGGLDPLAVCAYEMTTRAPARERRARVLYRMAESRAALRVCEEIRADPKNWEERLFAEEFADRILKKKRHKRTTEMLRDADEIRLSGAYEGCVEDATVSWFKERGFCAAHVENALWRAVFCLVLWDVLFDEDAGALHHPLARGPSDLFTSEFLDRRRSGIEDALVRLETSGSFVDALRCRYFEKTGVSLPLMSWHESLREPLFVCLQHITPKQLRAVVMEMAIDLKQRSIGFPDLIVWSDSGFELVEVKSDGDTLSAAQLRWLRVFRDIGVRARVLRVRRQR
ncbi:MAG: VRR-NUC domain-containing protein [Myxococcota bacterium]